MKKFLIIQVLILLLANILFAQSIRTELSEKEKELFYNFLKNQIEREVATGNPKLYFLTKMENYNYVSAIDLYDIFEENSLRGEAFIDSTRSIVISGNIDSISTMNSPLLSQRDKKIAVLKLNVSKSDYELRNPLTLLMLNQEYMEKAIHLKKGNYISIICHSNQKNIVDIPFQIIFENCRDIETYAEQSANGNVKLLTHVLNLHYRENNKSIDKESLEHNNSVINNILTKPLASYTARFLYFINKNENITEEKSTIINEKWERSFLNNSKNFTDFLKDLNLPNSN